MPSRTPLDDSVVLQAPSDPVLSQLNDPNFDPVNFLNNSLPNLSFSTQGSTPKQTRSTQIQNTLTEVQALLTKLNTHNVRASSDLTSLTDEILRNGNRLAYEVEILRGDVNNLYDLLSETLKEDIGHFVQAEVQNQTVNGAVDTEVMEDSPPHGGLDSPEFMKQLRMLSTVRSRLESVVTVFGEAMKWPLPPSDLSMTSSLISVSAPELGMQNTEEDDKAREIARTIRAEISDLLDYEGGGYTGLEAAAKRVEEYREVASIWKGTVEEKPRTRFVDSLAKMVEDRKKSLDAKGTSQRSAGEANQRSNSAGPQRASRLDSGPAGGLFRNLARLKDDLYLD